MADGEVSLGEIRRQPEFLLGLLERQSELVSILQSYEREGALWEINAFGCGDGYFAAESAEIAFDKSSRVSYRGLPSLKFLLNASVNVGTSSLLVPISMSGSVNRTIEATLAGQSQGAFSLAITNSTSGHLARIVDRIFLLGIEQPRSFLAGTVTYSSSLLALYMLAHALQLLRTDVDMKALNHPLRKMLERLSASLPYLESQTEQFVTDHYNAGRVYILAAGTSLASARYAAAKFCELTRTVALAQELEEFAHSNYWQVDENDLIIILSDGARQHPHAIRTALGLHEFGATVLVLATDGARQLDDVAVITVPNSGMGTAALAFAVPLQLIAHFWSLQQGLDPDIRSHLTGDTKRFKISRKLTRQGADEADR